MEAMSHDDRFAIFCIVVACLLAAIALAVALSR